MRYGVWAYMRKGKNIFVNVYVFILRERENKWGRGREQKNPSRLYTVSAEPNAAQSHKP